MQVQSTTDQTLHFCRKVVNSVVRVYGCNLEVQVKTDVLSTVLVIHYVKVSDQIV